MSNLLISTNMSVYGLLGCNAYLPSKDSRCAAKRFNNL